MVLWRDCVCWCVLSLNFGGFVYCIYSFCVLGCVCWWLSSVLQVGQIRYVYPRSGRLVFECWCLLVSVVWQWGHIPMFWCELLWVCDVSVILIVVLCVVMVASLRELHSGHWIWRGDSM